MAETHKARPRRKAERFFETYVRHPGIDIGCGHDPVDLDFFRFDRDFYRCGDPTLMAGVPDGFYHTVYSSHLLEHLDDPVLAVRNWYRILAPLGHLIVVVPHRDLYERRLTLPSVWNKEHKSFYMPDEADPPHTRSLKDTVLGAAPGAELLVLRTLDAGWKPLPEKVHACGEYSIEIVVRKPDPS